jgi:hypothetical protein
MEKVVHLFKIFKTLVYFKFLKLGKVKFGLIKVWKILNVFKLFEFLKRLKPFWPRVARDCSGGPPVIPRLSPIRRRPRAPWLGHCRPPATYRSGWDPPPPPHCMAPSRDSPTLSTSHRHTGIRGWHHRRSAPFLPPPLPHSLLHRQRKHTPSLPLVLMFVSCDRSAAVTVRVWTTAAISSPLWWAHPSGHYHPHCRPPLTPLWTPQVVGTILRRRQPQEHSHYRDVVTTASSSPPHRWQRDQVSPALPQLARRAHLAPQMLTPPPHRHLHAWAATGSRIAAHAPRMVTASRARATQRFGSGRLGCFGRERAPFFLIFNFCL